MVRWTFRAGVIVSVVWLCVALLVLFGYATWTIKGPQPPGPPDPAAAGADWTALLSLGTLLITGVGTLSTVLLSWRVDRRQAREFELRIRELEHQLTKQAK